MDKTSRTKNSLLNSLAGMISYAFVMIATLATRTMFARYLGEELLGLNTLFTSVLQILQITELGIGNAIIVFLYEPVKYADKEKTKALIRLYKRVYNIFAFALLVIGIIVQFTIIPRIVNVKTVDMVTVQRYYSLFLLGIVSSYVFAYSKSIFYAEQKVRVISIVNAAQKTIISVFQVLVIFCFENYDLYLILLIVGYLGENLICHYTVMKRHSYLREKCSYKISEKDKKDILNLIKSIFTVKIADKILGQSDSLIINQMIDIITLGMYGNYHTIFNACQGLYTPIGAALTSSYGNLSVGASSQQRYEAYRKSYVMFHFIAVYFCVLFFALIQDFIFILYGEKYVFKNSLYLVMTIYLYVTLVKTIYYSYQNSMGLHRLDQKQTVLQVPFNIIVSIFFAKWLGITGVIWGTIVSILIFSIGFKGKFLYEIAFGQKASKYYIKTFKDALLTSGVFILAYLLSNLVLVTTVVGFLVKSVLLSFGLVCICIAVFSIDSEFRRSSYFLMQKIRRVSA